MIDVSLEMFYLWFSMDGLRWFMLFAHDVIITHMMVQVLAVQLKQSKLKQKSNYKQTNTCLLFV